MTARVVLDTNVIISALLFPNGSVGWIRSGWRLGSWRPLLSRETVLEATRVLAYPKFRLGESERNALLAEYLPWGEVVAVPADIDVPYCRDPKDRPFLALALVGKADALITGDQDLLTMGMVGSTTILTPAEFGTREGGHEPSSS